LNRLFPQTAPAQAIEKGKQKRKKRKISTQVNKSSKSKGTSKMHEKIIGSSIDTKVKFSEGSKELTNDNYLAKVKRLNTSIPDDINK
jgi:hypothetical protein